MSKLRSLVVQVMIVGNVSHSRWEFLHRVINLACLLIAGFEACGPLQQILPAQHRHSG